MALSNLNPEAEVKNFFFFSCCLVTKLSLTPATLWTVIFQAPLSMGFPRQEYWSVLPFPSSGDLPDPRIQPVSPALAHRFFITEPPGSPFFSVKDPKIC